MSQPDTAPYLAAYGVCERAGKIAITLSRDVGEDVIIFPTDEHAETFAACIMEHVQARRPKKVNTISGPNKG